MSYRKVAKITSDLSSLPSKSSILAMQDLVVGRNHVLDNVTSAIVLYNADGLL